MLMMAADARAHFTHIWSIDNVSKLTHIHLQSPPFITHSISKVRWCIEIAALDIWSIHCSLDTGGHIRKRKKKGTSSLDIVFSLLAADGSPLISNRNNKSSYYVYLLSKYELLERWAEFVPNKTLTLRCRIWRKGRKIPTTDLCYARTRLKTHARSILWPIKEFSALNSSTAEDFRKLAKNERKIYSLKNWIKMGHFTGLVFYLKRNPECEDVCVDFLVEIGTDYNYSCEIEILDADGEVVLSKVEADRTFGGREIFKFRNLISKNKLISNKDLYLRNDTLLLRCSLKVCSSTISNEIEYCTPNVSSVLEGRERLDINAAINFPESPTVFEKYFLKYVDENYLADDPIEQKRDSVSCNDLCPLKFALKYLHSETTLSDINLQVGTKIYPVHKNVLSYRSPVFKTNFSKEDNIIEIHNMDENTLCRLLQYIYTDTVGDLQYEIALDLFKAATDYQLLDLKDKCSDILSLSNKYQEQKLEVEAEDVDSGLHSKIKVNKYSKQAARCNLM